MEQHQQALEERRLDADLPGRGPTTAGCWAVVETSSADRGAAEGPELSSSAYRRRVLGEGSCDRRISHWTPAKPSRSQANPAPTPTKSSRATPCRSRRPGPG